MLCVSTSEYYWWLTGDKRGWLVRCAEGRDATEQDRVDAAGSMRHHERAHALPAFPLPISAEKEAEIAERVRIFFEEPGKLPEPSEPLWGEQAIHPPFFGVTTTGEWATATAKPLTLERLREYRRDADSKGVNS